MATEVTVKLPTLKELNELTASQNMLLLLRTLNTSDLTFTYHLLAYDTVQDIEQMASHLLAMDMVDSETAGGLTPEERTEFLEYCTALAEFAR